MKDKLYEHINIIDILNEQIMAILDLMCSANDCVDIKMEALSRKYHHDQYKIKNILQESGAIEEVVALSLPEAKTRTWFPEKIIVQGKEYYDVSSAPTPDGFLEFGIESVKTQKFPEWKRELQRQWNRSNGRRGVNFGVEV